LLPGLDEFTGGAVDPRQTAQLHERQQQVRAALAELNEDDRRVLVMKYSMDWSAAQMGTVMGCTAAAIDMRLSRARRRLAEILVERGYQHEQF
jgi:RNA polymerase sigma factor (sigma-70 family)